MSAALDLYAKLTEATDDKERARIIADAYDALDARFPQLNDLATQGHVRESELRLQKEIKEVEGRLQKEIKEVEARLQKEIKELELQIREVEARLQEQIKGVELQIKQVEVNLHQAMAAQTRWLLGGLAVLGAVFKLADLLIGP
ncbi:MAG: DUF1640 domain-containing protein [Gammaproteobacteria bacterium]|jgi:septal ring factor EnvC (AmiA/AmiB activator)|nr:DUF1640 domain-containing protein [Gammaproteobacteria bacterium]